MEDNRELRSQLMNEISDELQKLHLVEPGSEEESAIVENVNKLSKLVFELDSKDSNKGEMRKERIMKWVLGLSGFGLGVAQIIHEAIWLRRGFKFEETGVFTSIGCKNLFNRIFKFRR